MEDAFSLRMGGLAVTLCERLASTKWRRAPASLLDTIPRLLVRTSGFIVLSICVLCAGAHRVNMCRCVRALA